MSEHKEEKDFIADNTAMLVKSAVNPSSVMDAMLRTWEALSTWWTFPLLMFLRPRFGTMHVHPLNQISAILLWNMIGFAGLILSIPSFGRAGYPIGLPVLTVVFWVAFIYHMHRCRKLMLNMSLEADSEDEGPTLGFLERLPGGHSWTTMSMAIQPLFVLAVALLLLAVHLLHPFAFLYLFTMALGLVFRAFVEWFIAWSMIRRQLDQINRLPKLQAIIHGQSAPQSATGDVLRTIAVTATPKQRGQIYAKLNGLESQYEAMVTKPEGAGD